MLLRPEGQFRCLYQRIPVFPHLVKSSLYVSLRAYSTPQPRAYRNSPKSKLSNDQAQCQASVQHKPSISPTISGQIILPAKSNPDPLNPLATTRPPKLTFPPRPADLPAYKYYFHLGKAYAQFYKTGLKAIYTSWKAARALPNGLYNASVSQLREAMKNGALTRADFQLIRRARNNVNKIPPFVLLWMICGEFTPLIVIFVSGLVPRTIWIPKQVQAARRKAEARRKLAHKDSSVNLVTPMRFEMIDSMLEPQRTNSLHFFARSRGLYPAWWDRLPDNLIPMWLVVRRVKERMNYLEIDDFAVERDGGIGRMEEEEVVWALEERGIDVLGKNEEQLRKKLKTWMEQRTLGEGKT